MAKIPPAAGWSSDDWRRWFDELIDQARACLRGLSDLEGREAAKQVHAVRKTLKRLRSATRLLKGVVPQEVLRRNRLLFRDAARLLAGSRDGTVRLQTFHSLVGANERKTRDLADVRLALATEAARGEEQAGAGAEEALALLEKVACPRRFWGAAGEVRIKRNLGALLKRARRDYRDVMTGKSLEFHELRKRVKDLFYSLQALPGEPKGSRRRALKSLKTLEESLGLQNDLFVLEEWFNERGYGLKQCPRFWQAASRRERKLRKRIKREGALLEELGRDPKYRKAFASSA